MEIITPEQCRAARAYLGWTQQELAERAKVNKNTVASLESGKHITSLRSLRYIKYALESGGLCLLRGGGIVPAEARQ